MLYAERKAQKVPVLRFNEYDEQRNKAYQADWDQANTILQGLEAQVHAQESKTGAIETDGTMDIIKLAFDMTASVQVFVDKVRQFYYWVMLFNTIFQLLVFCACFSSGNIRKSFYIKG